MTRLLAAAAALMLAGVSTVAQDNIQTDTGQGARLKALDTITGEVSELEATSGETIRYQKLEITVLECRFPMGQPGLDAFAQLRIKDERRAEPDFDGWMIASSPALSALEHPRYDVWVTSCMTSS